MVSKLLRTVIYTDGGGYHDLALDMDKLINQVHLAFRVKRRPLHESLVDNLEDSVTHCAQFTGEKRMCDHFAARFVGGQIRLHRKDAIVEHLSEKHPYVRSLVRKLVVGHEYVLCIVGVCDHEAQALRPKLTKRGRGCVSVLLP